MALAAADRAGDVARFAHVAAADGRVFSAGCVLRSRADRGLRAARGTPKAKHTFRPWLGPVPVEGAQMRPIADDWEWRAGRVSWVASARVRDSPKAVGAERPAPRQGLVREPGEPGAVLPMTS